MTTDSPKRPASPFDVTDPRSDIPPGERDRALLGAGRWPSATEQALKSEWEVRGKHLFRRIDVYGEGEDKSKGADPHELWEVLLRFPNSPLYATHRTRKHPFPLEPWPNLHTMRVIGHGSEPGAKIKHVYLLHNGLNETTDFLFHYRLAAWILGERDDAVCILRPLPGHLTRFPFDGPYVELPLDSYLRDPADLFRQFVRYMQETKWLLSALVPRPHYDVAAGMSLLAEHRPTRPDSRSVGRANNNTLARAIEEDWQAAFDSSELADTNRELRSTHSKQRVSQAVAKAAIVELRELLNWEPLISTVGPEHVGAEGHESAETESPCIHVVGYSMGGFMAQAVFFAWPFAVSSCTNLFAGGALRDLAPTAFAHPEEWQAVLHAMRYELDRAFRDDYLKPSNDGRVAGISEGSFEYFTRIFYEVYLQYYRGGYASRVSEFSRRLLFIVGGDDPIVRTKNVLDAGPPRGMTLLQIADVSHFPGGRSPNAPDGGKVESDQRRYWLPEVGRIIAKFSEQSEDLLHRTLAECWLSADDESGEKQGSTAVDVASPEQPGEQDPTMLASAAFATELENLVDCSQRRSEKQTKGWLLVSRNELSPVFLGPDAFRFYAQAIHHSEDQIARYMQVLRERSKRLVDGRDRVTLLVPAGSESSLLSYEERRTFLSKSETPSASDIPGVGDLAEMERVFREDWIEMGAVGLVAVNEYEPTDLAPVGPVAADRLQLDKLPLTILPDVWIAFSYVVTEAIRESNDDGRQDNEEAIVGWATKLAKSEPKKELKKLKEWIDSGDVVAITVSGAELNPRYRGHRLLKEKDVGRAIVHWALAYLASNLSKTP